MDKKCCGKCKWHKPTYEMPDEWYCANPDADLYEIETEYGDCEDCMDFEERE